MRETAVPVEVILAAVVDSQGGSVAVPADTFDKDLSGFVLAMDFDAEANQLLITLVDKEDALYEDE